jgi:phospholipid/cholesterol/gamma-HCH transport system substrate-binding protein
MVTQAPRRGAVLAAVAFTLSCIGLMIFVWTQFGGTLPFAPRGYQVKALFSETGLLVPGADVRISGVNVGRVTAVSPRGVDSLVTMQVAQQYSPVPADTRAILRQKTLLGEAYVELSAGDRGGRSLPDGGMLPRSQVASTQQLDQLLGTFGQPTRQDLNRFLSGSSTVLAGRSDELSGALGDLDPAVTDLQEISASLDAQRGDLRSLLRGSASVLDTLGQRSDDLQTLIRAGEKVLSATASRTAALSATVDRLPPFLSQLRTTLGQLGVTLTLARPSIRSLRRSAPLLRPALSDVITLSGPALALLHAAPRLLHDAVVALPAITRFTDAFRPALGALLPAVHQIVPVIDFIGVYRKELVTAMANLSASLEATAPAHTNGWPDRPGSASYLRAISMVGNESLFGQSVREPTNRDNTNYAPGELTYLARGGLLAASCANVHNASQSALHFPNVPCRVQPGFDWNSLVRYFPHVTAGSKP